MKNFFDELKKNFFFSSLLIVYEGKDKQSSKIQRLDSVNITSEDDYVSENESDEDSIEVDDVTMKMIDFAHSTFEGFLDDPITHSGPDSGYLKGLDTLIRIIFRNLKEDIDLRKANA